MITNRVHNAQPKVVLLASARKTTLITRNIESCSLTSLKRSTSPKGTGWPAKNIGKIHNKTIILKLCIYR